MKIIPILAIALILTSCSSKTVPEYASDKEQDSLQDVQAAQDDISQPEQEYIHANYVQLGSDDFWIQEELLKYETPDFLNEEQQQLYLRALSLYPIFNGSPMTITEYPSKDGSYPTPDISGTEETLEIDGLAYLRVFGRYAEWSDFKEMMLSVYTEEYFPKIAWNCTEHNEDTYILDSAAGMPFYSDREKAPDTFELVSTSDSEIIFSRYQYFFESGIETPVFGIKYDIVMKKVNDIWRVDLFEKDCEVEPQ